MSRLLRVTLALLLTLTVGSWAFAGCLPSDPSAMDDMSCCQTGEHDCGPAMKVADCCRIDAPAPATFVVLKLAAAVNPLVALAHPMGADVAVPAMFRPLGPIAPLVTSSPPLGDRLVSLRI